MYNILGEGMNDAERHALLQHLIHIKPPLVVVIDRLSFALEIKAALPQTAVVFRRYHPSNNGGDDGVHRKLSPEQWLSSYYDVPPSAGLWLYQNNEPGIEPLTFTHAQRCAELALSAGYKVCLINWSVGVPQPEDWERPEALSLLRYAGANKSRVMIGVHEYAASFSGMEWGLPPDPAQWPNAVGGVSWLLTRYRNIYKACDKHGVPRPMIGVTEASFDYIHAAASYQDMLPHTSGLIGALWANIEAWQRMKPVRFEWPQYMVEQLHWMYRVLYASDPNVVGVANFCWGSFEGSRWRLYDISRVPNIAPLMQAKNWTKVMTTPTPTITPNAWINGTSPAVNVRSSASTSSTVVRTLSDKGELVKIARFETVGQYIWHEYQFLNAAKGWVRNDVHDDVALRASVLLDVPYKKQFGDSTNDDRNNDCAAACIAMLLGFEGVNITVDEVTAVINQPEGLVHFRHLIPAIETLGFKSEVRQGQRLSNILRSLNDGRPMMTLVNYEHLRGDAKYQYGHFVVPIGYWLESQTLMIRVHDPYNAASMEFPASRFAKAIAEMEGTDNTAFQTLYFTGRTNPPAPDDPPPGVHLATIRQHAVTMRDAANDIIRIIDTIAG